MRRNATVAALVVLLGACSGGSGQTQTVTVSAAASLTDAMDRIVEVFEAERPDVEVRVNYGSSTRLAQQVLAGAPADVAAFADEESMATLVDAGLVEGDPEVFATNELVLATRPGNPEGIRSLGNLGEVGVVALCAEVAPCGRYAQELLGSAGVRLDESRVTRGQNATATLTALTEGDADAAILYRSDAVRAGDRLELVTIPEGLGPLARYPAAVLRDGDGSAADGAARDFLTHLRSGRSARVLAEAGFGTP